MLCCRASCCETGVHPHSRGENRGGLEVCRQLRGSSPLARGKCTARYGCRFSSRFIPTRAGKMKGHGPRVQSMTVHPHSRGENHTQAHAVSSTTGSSPLARGKSSDLYNLDLGTRFIPTRAGKIVSRLLTATLTWVHPHSRGENQSWRTIPTTASGSSPLARGKSP